MDVYFNIAQIIISAALVAIILLQIKNSNLGGIFGGTDSAIFRTRRGVERTLLNITIGLSVAFFVITILNAIVIS
jgi:preprotein translocase subunit SecG